MFLSGQRSGRRGHKKRTNRKQLKITLTTFANHRGSIHKLQSVIKG